jgi:hypothetical protein
VTKTDIHFWKTARNLAAPGKNCCKKRFGSKEQIFGMKSQATIFNPPLTGGMSNFLFTCPSTNLNVQHWRDDDDEDVSDNEYEAVTCKACARLHLINRKTGRVLGQMDWAARR